MRKTIALLLILYAFASPVLAATDVKNDGTLGTNLNAAWFSDAVAIETDLTGGGNDFDNNVGPVTTGVGKNGNAADFEAADSSYFDIADNADISPTTAATFAFWIKYESYGTGGQTPMFFRKYGGVGERSYIYEVSVSGSTHTPRFSYFDGASFRDATASAGVTQNTGTWYHHCVTFNAGSVIYYVDGTKIGNTITAGGSAIADGTGTLYISSSNGTGQYVDGLMHQLLIYDKVLSESDCQSLYAAGAGIPYEAVGEDPVYKQTTIQGDVIINGDVKLR